MFCSNPQSKTRCLIEMGIEMSPRHLETEADLKEIHRTLQK